MTGAAGAVRPGRVFDTLLDETSILGLALGDGGHGLLPIPEIQYLAYLHNAEDQLRGEAATLQFFSQGAVPQRDGRAHPGLRLPEGLRRPLPQRQRARRAARHSRPRDRLAGAARRRRGDAARRAWPRRRRTAASASSSSRSRSTTPATSRRRATTCGSPSRGREHVPIGAGEDAPRRRRPHDRDVGERPADVTARRAPAARAGVDARVVDLRWLAPLPIDDILREATATGRVLVVDETRRTGGVGEGIVAALVDAGLPRRACARVEQGLVHPARRRRTPRPGLRGRDRGGGGASAGPLGPLPCSRARSRCSWSRPSSRAAQRRSTIQTTMPRSATTVLKIRTSVTPPSSFPGAGGRKRASPRPGRRRPSWVGGSRCGGRDPLRH